MATSNRFNFNEVKIRLERTKRDLPVRLAKQAEGFFVQSFKDQAWDGRNWQTPQRRIPGTYAYKYPKSKGLTRRTKPTLVGTSALLRATSNSIRNATWSLIKLQVDLPYAAAHNEGLGNMPKRTFMGQSKRLENKQKTLITETIDKIWV